MAPAPAALAAPAAPAALTAPAAPAALAAPAAPAAPVAPVIPAIPVIPAPAISANPDSLEFLHFVPPCPWPTQINVNLTSWGYPSVLAGLALLGPPALPPVGSRDVHGVLGSIDRAEHARHPLSMFLDVRPSPEELTLFTPEPWLCNERHLGSNPIFVLALCTVRPHMRRILSAFRRKFASLVQSIPDPRVEPALPVIHIALVDESDGHLWADAWRVLLRHALGRRSYMAHSFKAAQGPCSCPHCVASPLTAAQSTLLCQGMTAGYMSGR